MQGTKLRSTLGTIRRNLMQTTSQMIRVIRGEEVLYHPEISCTKKRLGSDYGGWTICPDALTSHSIVYSVGLGIDITFDRAIIENYGVAVFGFDPTPFSLSYLQSQSLPKQFHYFPYALSDHDGTLPFFPPSDKRNISFSLLKRATPQAEAVMVTARRLSTIMQELGHDHLDILKLDVEGAEYGIIEDVLQSGIRPRQFLIEFHHRYSEVGFAKTQSAINALHQAHYSIFDIGRGGFDYSFMHLP